jgi:ribosomal protein L30, bacterial/organelle
MRVFCRIVDRKFAMLKVKLVKSRIGSLPKQRKVLDSLGLRKMHTVKTFEDTAAIRGMIAKVSHMVEVSN